MILSYHEIRKFHLKRQEIYVEGLVLYTAKETGFSYRRLKAFIKRKYSIPLNENTIKSTLRRNNFKREKRKRKKSGRHLYDYEALLPFEELQLGLQHTPMSLTLLLVR